MSTLAIFAVPSNVTDPIMIALGVACVPLITVATTVGVLMVCPAPSNAVKSNENKSVSLNIRSSNILASSQDMIFRLVFLCSRSHRRHYFPESLFGKNNPYSHRCNNHPAQVGGNGSGLHEHRSHQRPHPAAFFIGLL